MYIHNVYIFFLFFFLGWRIPNLIIGLSGWYVFWTIADLPCGRPDSGSKQFTMFVGFELSALFASVTIPLH